MSMRFCWRVISDSDVGERILRSQEVHKLYFFSPIYTLSCDHAVILCVFLNPYYNNPTTTPAQSQPVMSSCAYMPFA